MTYVFDIDGTICTLTDGNYEEATPFLKRIEKINSLYESGNSVIYYTARGMGRYDNNGALAREEFWSFTVDQLKTWGAKFDKVILGKPAGDVYVDDKGVRDEDFFRN